MADSTVNEIAGEGNMAEPGTPFGYRALYDGRKVTIGELDSRLRAIMQMSWGMAAVMEKVIDNPHMDYETSSITRLLRAGLREIEKQANRLEPCPGLLPPGCKDAA